MKTTIRIVLFSVVSLTGVPSFSAGLLLTCTEILRFGLPEHANQIDSMTAEFGTPIAASSDGEVIVAGHESGYLTMWGHDRNSPVARWKASSSGEKQAIYEVALSPDANLIASVSAAGVLEVYGRKGGALFSKKYPSSFWTSLGTNLQRAKEFFANKYYEPEIKVAGLLHLNEMFERIPVIPISVAFSPDGSKLAVGTRGIGFVSIIDTKTWKVIRTVKTPLSEVKVRFNHSGSALALEGYDSEINHTVFIWDGSSKKMNRLIRLEDHPLDFRFSADDSDLIAVERRNLRIFTINLKTGTSRTLDLGLDDTSPVLVSSHQAVIRNDGRGLFVKRGQDLRYFDIAAQAWGVALKTGEDISRYRSLFLTADDKHLVTFDRTPEGHQYNPDNYVHVFSVE